ncbi:MAG: hypothetical protein U5K56_00530 [Halioglobus sp.]|nr:hypothetical protein [Halioglobus sp.]
MKNITLSADGKLIEAARSRARAEHTTLNVQFREWLEMYARQSGRLQQYDTVIEALQGRVTLGRHLSREEMNER